MALERLAELEYPIKWLANDLENSTNNDYCYDGANICNKLLSNEEFKVVKALVKLLYPFDKATEILSRSNYTTLSIIVPTIEKLVYRLNNTDSDFDIINKVKEEILSNLSSQWSLLHDYGMYVSLLDPRFKNLSFCSNQYDEFVEQTEIDKYLALPEIETTEENNLVVWWKQRRLKFPILCILAKKYLAIPTSFVPSECLFSDASNYVTPKQN
ncbi:11741_t:CDS:2 [Dentiscutata heterogama]|uniref:11741_t:CDS:1 n=1 Tax=Dentiscutata heterogama TaxID=1316150 RepID=A0ACA9MAM6_9GLOM|nr:11741_t:CDS:2 [Dentiscutata heterogama]